MKIPQITADLMVKDVKTCCTTDTLGHARLLMKEFRIRHLPVVDPDSGDYVGVVTQKAILREALEIANKFGMADLEYQESKRLVDSIMEKDAETVQPQLSLRDAGRFFVESKHGCLPVLEGGKVVGILSSADFVKLSVQLLEYLESK